MLKHDNDTLDAHNTFYLILKLFIKEVTLLSKTGMSLTYQEGYEEEDSTVNSRLSGMIAGLTIPVKTKSTKITEKTSYSYL